MRLPAPHLHCPSRLSSSHRQDLSPRPSPPSRPSATISRLTAETNHIPACPFFSPAPSTHRPLLFPLLLLPDHIIYSPVTKPRHKPRPRSNNPHCSRVSAGSTITHNGARPCPEPTETLAASTPPASARRIGSLNDHLQPMAAPGLVHRPEANPPPCLQPAPHSIPTRPLTKAQPAKPPQCHDLASDR